MHPNGPNGGDGNDQSESVDDQLFDLLVADYVDPQSNGNIGCSSSNSGEQSQAMTSGTERTGMFMRIGAGTDPRVTDFVYNGRFGSRCFFSIRHNPGKIEIKCPTLDLKLEVPSLQTNPLKCPSAADYLIKTWGRLLAFMCGGFYCYVGQSNASAENDHNQLAEASIRMYKRELVAQGIRKQMISLAAAVAKRAVVVYDHVASELKSVERDRSASAAGSGIRVVNSSLSRNVLKNLSQGGTVLTGPDTVSKASKGLSEHSTQDNLHKETEKHSMQQCRKKSTRPRR